MIQLHLGDEPEALTTARAAATPLAIDAFNRWQTEQNADKRAEARRAFVETLTGYDAGAHEARVKRVLWTRQHEKCAWCERSLDWEAMPIEHIRPKARTDGLTRAEVADSEVHYWWLTWSWENLVFSCFGCNSRKSTYYPMVHDTPRVSPPVAPVVPGPDGVVDFCAHDPANEQPLLLNPRAESPLSHLEWSPAQRAGHPKEWKWTARGTTDRGHVTVTILELHRRADNLRRYFKRALLNPWESVEDSIKAKDLAKAAQLWSKLVDDLVDDPEAEYRGAAWRALEALVPAELRDGLGFRHPTPPSLTWTAPIPEAAPEPDTAPIDLAPAAADDDVAPGARKGTKRRREP